MSDEMDICRWQENLQYVYTIPINNMPLLVQIMTDQATNHYLNQWSPILPRHIYALRRLNGSIKISLIISVILKYVQYRKIISVMIVQIIPNVNLRSLPWNYCINKL